MVKFPGFGRRRQQPGLALPPGLLRGPSLYVFLQAHYDPAGGHFSKAAEVLPDAERRFAGWGVGWAPGAFDGVAGRLHGVGSDWRTAGRMIVLLKRIAEKGNEHAKRILYGLLKADTLLEFLEPFLGDMADHELPPEPYLYSFIRALATEASDRGPVKFALVMLGLLGRPDDEALLTFFGRHDEFTYFAVEGLKRLLDDPEPAIWALAQATRGWGRIQAVEQLSQPQSPAVKDWLLREGHRNSVMADYSAYRCAVAGDLAGALAQETDDELLHRAGELLLSLIYVAGEGFWGMDDYGDAALAVSRYLAQVERCGCADRCLPVVKAILEYLTREEWNSSTQEATGWTDEARADALAAVRRIAAD